jgi:stage V sporulation protein R
MAQSLPFTDELRKMQLDVEAVAREYGLSFPQIVYELLDSSTLNMVASYGGFPVRYPHWRFGMEYFDFSKRYSYGYHRIYEMVINTVPVIAYLLASNLMTDQKMVMAHVCAHADFFTNNMWFASTNRNMMNEMANHSARIRGIANRHGFDAVEEFLDTCLSLENLIDNHSVAIARKPLVDHCKTCKHGEDSVRYPVDRDYMEDFINPRSKRSEECERHKRERENAPEKFPVQPERDMLMFLLENAPLKDWQLEILDIIREEAYYFAPQRQTKIMNEGWAAFWHSKIMTERIGRPDEIVDYADHNSMVVFQGHHLNPYRLGLDIYRDIEDRWNRGAFGREWEECNDLRVKEQWDKKLGLGLEKIFEVRTIYNDLTFIDEFFTKDLIERMMAYTVKYDKDSNGWYIDSRAFDRVRETILFQLTNCGQPVMEIINANYNNRSELYILHKFEGIGLDMAWAEGAMRSLLKIWKRPVHVETAYLDENKGKLEYRLLHLNESNFWVEAISEDQTNIKYKKR